MGPLRVVWLAALLGGVLVLPQAADPLVACVIWVGCLAVLAWTHPTGLLSLAALYLLLLGIFHLGIVGPLALGASGIEHPPWLRSGHFGSAVSLFTAATVAFTLGAQLRLRPAAEAGQGSVPPEKHLFWTGCAVAAVGAVLLWTGILQLGILSSAYDTVFERAVTEDHRFFGFGLELFPLGVLVAAGGATRRQMLALGLLVAAVLGPPFLTGFRGPAMVHVTALLAVWARKDPRTARRIALGIAVAMIFVLPAIRKARDTDKQVLDNVSGFDPLSVLVETGGSMYPLVLTAEQVNTNKEPLWKGRSYAYSVSRIVPNLGARQASTPMLMPSAWATRLADPWAFEHGGGIGFSGVAEPYLNFGLAGVVLGFFGLGFLMQLWDRAPRTPFRYAVGAATFGFLLWTVRNDSIALFRAFAYGSATVLAAWTWSRFLSAPTREARHARDEAAGASPSA